MDIKEFKKQVKKVSGNRTHKVKDSLGVKDMFIHYRKNKPKGKEFIVTETLYREVIRELNRRLGEELLTTGILRLPLEFGKLKVYKKVTKPFFKDGKLIYNAPIDWNTTLELWATDNEAKIAKTLVKTKPGACYTIKYDGRPKDFKNKEFFSFNITREVKMNLKDKINNNIDIPHYRYEKPKN